MSEIVRAEGKRCAVVTGASRGIGAAIAKRLALSGYSVIVNYAMNLAAAQDVVAAIRAAGGEAVAVRADVASYSQSKELIDAAVTHFGGLHALINNAGITRDGLIARMSEGDWDDVLLTNLKSAYNCARHAAPLLMKRRAGRIINISSVSGIMGNAGQANYAASKAGLIGLTKSLARELAPRGVTVNAVAPGFIQTDMTGVLDEDARERLYGRIPLQTLGEPEQVAAAVAFLASDDAAYITGQVLCVDGGMAM